MADEGAIPEQLQDEPLRRLTRPGGLPANAASCQGVHDRVLGMEFWRLEVERRLSAGVAQFTELKNSMSALQPKPRSFTSMLPFLIPVIILAGTMLWQAARYPDRREFEDVKVQMSSFRVEQAKTTEQLVRALESVARLETRQTNDSAKLDQLLDRGADSKPTTRRRAP
jgi:hypothetical protein